jgi:hypothetical protein
MKRKKILCVAYGGGHATMISPVVQHLNTHYADQVDCITLALTMGGVHFKRCGLPYLGFKDFITDIDQDALNWGKKLAGKEHSDHTQIPYEESIAYLGLSYVDLIQRFGETEAAKQYAEKGRMAFYPLSVMQRIFDQINPDFVLTTNSPRAEAAALQVANERNITSMALTDLVGKFTRPLKVDHICVASRSALDIYKQSNLAEAKQYHLTGNPAMDHASSAQQQDGTAWRKKHYPENITKNTWVLLAEQEGYWHETESWILWEEAQIIDNLERVYTACQSQKATLLIRPHPTMKPELYTNWARTKPPSTVFMADHHPLYELLNACDLLLSNNSSIMLNMLYMQKPILLIHYANDMSYLPLDQLGCAFTAPITDALALSAEIGRALHDAQAQKNYHNAFSNEFPRLPCAARAATLIASLLLVDSP